MKQIFCKHFFYANYGAATEYVPLIAGDNLSFANGGGATGSRQVWSCTGVLRNLVINLPVVTGHTTTWTVMLNGVATLLTCTLGAADLTGSDLLHDIAVVAGDDLELKLVGTTMSSPGYGGGYSIEFEGVTASQSGYGIGAFGGSCSLASPTVAHRLGGSLGNGVFQLSPAVPADLGNTYSIVCTAGTVTRLDAKTFSGAPGSGVWTIMLVKNQVLQDGSGGTVDTRCVMTGSTTQTFSTFSLPVSAADHLETLVVRSVTSATSGTHVTTSVAFVSTATDVGNLCGGNNNAQSASAVEWEWNGSFQGPSTESEAQAPVGPTGFIATGLYIERSAAPGVDKQYVHLLRDTATNTALTVTVAGTNTSGSLLAQSVPFVDGDLINLKTTPTGTPLSGQLHWGLSISTAPPIDTDGDGIPDSEEQQNPQTPVSHITQWKIHRFDLKPRSEERA